MNDKIIDKIQETAEYINEQELLEFEKMDTQVDPQTEWRAWFEYQMAMVISAEEVTK